MGASPCPILILLRRTPRTMFDELWSEIQDMPGEIFDLNIPEIEDESNFNLNEYLNGDYDY